MSISMSFSMTLCPSLSPSPCLSISMSISMSFSMSFSMVYLSISVYICLYPSISVYICLYLSISVYLCLYLSISVYICLYLSISISISISISTYQSINQSINQSVYLWHKYITQISFPEFLRFSESHPSHPPGHHQHRFGARFCGPGSLASGHWDEQPHLVLLLRRPSLGPVRQRTGVHWERGKRELERHTRLRAGDVWEMRWGI